MSSSSYSSTHQSPLTVITSSSQSSCILRPISLSLYNHFLPNSLVLCGHQLWILLLTYCTVSSDLLFCSPLTNQVMSIVTTYSTCLDLRQLQRATWHGAREEQIPQPVPVRKTLGNQGLPVTCLFLQWFYFCGFQCCPSLSYPWACCWKPINLESTLFLSCHDVISVLPAIWDMESQSLVSIYLLLYTLFTLLLLGCRLSVTSSCFSLRFYIDDDIVM